MVPKKRDKIQRINIIKSAVFKLQELFQVDVLMVHDEIIRRAVHQGDQFAAFIDDGNPLTPGKCCRPKTHDLDILLFGKQMWYTNRVVFYKLRPVVLTYFGIEEGF